MGDGQSRTGREIARAYYEREPTVDEMKAMTRRLHTMTLRGILTREQTRTVIAVYVYRIAGAD